MRIERTVDVAAPPETVWAVMTDVERWPEWTGSVRRAAILDGADFGPGCRVRLRQPGFAPAVWQVTGFDPPRSFTWESRSLGTRAVGSHRVAANGRGSTVTLAVELEGWLIRVLAPWIASVSRRFVEMEALGLQRRCESAAAAARPSRPG